MVVFTYSDYNGVVTSRNVEPMTLLFKSGMWYLFGYCRFRSDFRLFKISRMREIQETGERFTRRTTSFREVFPQEPQFKNPITMQLLFSAGLRIRIEDFFSPSQLMIHKNGDCQAEFTVDDDEWIYSWLLSFGNQVTVLSPRSIRRKLLDYLAAVKKNYQT